MALRLFLCGLGLASGCNGLGCCRLILVFRLAVFGVWFWLGSDLFSFVYYLIYNVLNFVYVCLRQIFFLPPFLPALRAVFIGYRLFWGVLRIDWSCSRLGCYRGVLLVVLPVFSGVLLRVFFATSPPAQKPLGKGFAYLLAWVKSLFFFVDFAVLLHTDIYP